MKFERIMNTFFGWLFALLAIAALGAIISGAFHQIVTLLIGVVVSLAMFNENKKRVNIT